MEIMPKTIRELADELKVSKQTIQYHYQRLPTKNRQKDSQGTNMISLTAERIVRDKVAKPLVANTQQTGSKKVTKTSKENNELIATLRREIEDLKSQRDKQLATKDRQIDHLTKLVDQQQQLQLATLADNRRLKDHVQKLSGQLTQKTNDNLSTGNDLFNIQDKKSKIAKQKIVKSGSNKDGIHTNRAIKRWWKFW
ncbi:OrfX [Amylolactobacillus amylotrophicus DSM 20534]|uniref:OrfX n=3 Tax=Amylolactobacillus TaxID=2767876 RepID=A0A0R1YIM6_9LACO|nr:OrfX [Amylolactobacillus amylotrophicus DSM 20534]KRM42162.1 OrfX [Amylolactobacillus amylophilus DSM 20533 = JCM 1125]